MRVKILTSLQNWVSLAGLMIAAISFFIILVFLAVITITGEGGIYLGLVSYILLPAVMLAGLVIALIGFIVTARRRKTKEVEKPRWPLIDLENPKHRRHFVQFLIGTSVFLFFSLIGSFEAFHYTESNQFCGRLCHEVMEPEYVTYRNSPHAKVDCVECHVGPGNDWYVRSKLAGLYQVYSILANKYPKPIPTPIENMRLARELCEQCHWREKFYAHKMKFEQYYLYDEKNTPWNIRLVVKTGAKHQAHGLKEGIHWHINPDIKIEYISKDEKRQELPWVRYTNQATGEVIIYEDQDAPFASEEINDAEIRTMDCIDCHNRASHDFKEPMRFINEAMTAGNISAEIPEIKMMAMEVCSEEYDSTEEAMSTIESELITYYAENYPGYFAENQSKINEAAAALQQLYRRNFFPKMNLSWNSHLDNRGHLNFLGCFRCHNAAHESDAGDSIRHDCNLCHIITGQGAPDNMTIGSPRDPLEFQHPVDIYEIWKEAACSECHTGGGM
jgi:nitrate/TMAO reductase-like tetraheme cytochrome c subunit